MTPAVVDLFAFRGGGPLVDTTEFAAFDYSGATFVLEIRDWADKPGSPIIALTNAAPNAQGVSVTVATTGGIPTSTVQIRINETTIEGLPFGNPRGTDWRGVYALDITGGGHAKTRRMRGKFTVVAGENA
jgi:hypothetical protein